MLRHEINVKQNSKSRLIIEFCDSLLSNQDYSSVEIVFTAIGKAISKCVSCVEILKSKFPSMKQENELSSIEMEKKQGDNINIIKKSKMIITLTKVNL